MARAKHTPFRYLRKALALIGSRRDRLTVIGAFMSNPETGKAMLRCRCDCGAEITMLVAAFNTPRGRQSCGCLAREQRAASAKHHGVGTTTYNIWRSMKARCKNPGNSRYYCYGAKGITVCPEWQHDFEAFVRDMGWRPSPKHSIGRKDNTQGYFKDNCRWETSHGQARNMTTNKLITIGGVTLCQAEWAERFGLSQQTLWQRLHLNWDIERALTTPVRKRTCNHSMTSCIPTPECENPLFQASYAEAK